MNGLQALDQWQTYMKTPTGAWLGFINAIYWLGAGISYPIAAWASNKFGRKPGVFFGYTWLLLGIFVIFSKNHISFLLSRFFIGCASAWFGNAVPLLINEIAYPSHRGVANALFMSVSLILDLFLLTKLQVRLVCRWYYRRFHNLRNTRLQQQLGLANSDHATTLASTSRPSRTACLPRESKMVTIP